jgi:hypothetical protein
MRDWDPVTITLQALSLVEKAEPVQVRFTPSYTWGTNGVCEFNMDVKSTWIPTWALIGSCFMVTWIIFKNHLSEVGLTQNRKTMILWMLTTVDLLYFIVCEELHEWKFIETPLVEGLVTYDFTLQSKVHDHTTRCWRVCWDGLLTHSFGLPQFCGHDSWLVCRVAIRATSHTRLRARDHYTSTTLIGGKGIVGPSSLHTTFEGQTEYVNARWM